MDLLAERLQEIETGVVLEPGAGEGGFVKYLDQNLKSYKMIVGLDLSLKNIRNAVNLKRLMQSDDVLKRRRSVRNFYE